MNMHALAHLGVSCSSAHELGAVCKGIYDRQDHEEVVPAAGDRGVTWKPWFTGVMGVGCECNHWPATEGGEARPVV